MKKKITLSSLIKTWWPALVVAIIIIAIAIFKLPFNINGLADQPSAETNQGDDQAAVDANLIADESGVTWLGKPQLLAKNLKLVKDKLTSAYDEKTQQSKEVTLPATYYKLGTDNSQDIIVADVAAEGPGGDDYLLFRENGQTYELLASMISRYYFEDQTKPIGPNQKYVGPALEDGITINYDRVYPSIQAPEKLTVKNATLDASYTSHYFFFEYQNDNYSQLVKFADTPYGPLYTTSYRSVLEDKISGFAEQNLILKLPNGQAAAYQYTPAFITDDGVPRITWNDGSNTATYVSDGGGSCGSTGKIAVLTNVDESQLKIAGQTSTKEIVYEFNDPENKIIKALYENFLPDGTYYQYNEKKQVNENIPLTINEYIAQHGIFIYKDALGRNLLFRNRKFGIQAECGKPVIYLYPTTPTNISVAVDANITKSDPIYNNGWQVLAQPNGDLTTNDGQQYDSLFWEGTGHEYPDITSGFVVARADLETTLQTQLRELGLNNKEAQDFMDFWLPKMPTAPYTRLTWFGTQQMDNLAPLTIDPKPDTVIRIFLDFVGLETPIDIPPQRLSGPPRRGFTVVEWGGLLQK